MTNNKGLSLDEVEKSRKEFGSNEIEVHKKNKFLNLLLESFGDPIIKILLIALMIKIVFLFQDFDFYETIGILIAVILATFISTISEYGSEKAFLKLSEEAVKLKTKVIRDSKIIEILVSEVVVSDIVVLESGDKIPADGLIIDGNISVDESVLNGESKESKKEKYITGEVLDKHKLYRGTTVYSGRALMKVTSVGMNTMYGRLALEISEKEPTSPLKTRLTELAKVISRLGYVGAILVTIAYLFSKIVMENNYDPVLIKETITNFPMMMNYLIYAITLSVTVIVVAVPEGLPMMITLVLSSNMKRMLKNNVLVRKLVGIETAGNLNVLLTDKTGTLTKGKLEVINVLNGTFETVKIKESFNFKNNLYFDALYYNNDSTFSNKQIIGGNSTDRAILAYLNKDIKLKKQIINKKHFSSLDKYSSVTIYDKETITFFKGASEVLLPKCTKYLKNGIEEKIRSFDLINSHINEATKKGIRVIMLAYKKGNNSLDNLVFMGLIYLKDELREEARDGINLIKKAGVQVIMITGDSKETAMVIAKESGIIDTQQDLVLTSSEMNRLSDLELKEKLKNLRVVARALPSDKSRLVRVIEEMDLIVGMTGDGVNDAPALKKANVGFSMGSGTEVSKEASDIVILDNNILSISKAILYGRTIFKSIRKFIIYQLSVNMTALLLSIIGPFIGFTSPITIVQMLWLNMIMDTFAALAFSFEPALLEYMDESPKKIDEPIINSYMYNEIILTALYSGTLCILFLKLPFVHEFFRIGDNNKYLMTAYFALFIFIGIFNSFNARTYRINIFANILKNKIFLIVIGFIITVQIYLIYFGGDLFRTYGLTAKEFFMILGISLTVWPVDALRKLILKKKNLKRMV
ncbi:MAG: calcium-translocating P-type ATPase, PMCA-type [Bacilli bacterium]|nr:calcium-translocating P-type ATPase, PMCA-type [Bacilli bacterium]